jgi:DNA replication protein DnaC
MDQNFNLVLMGPSGTSKSSIAAGLCLDALKKGYKACFRNMEQLKYLLKMNALTKIAAREYQSALKADLMIIDDIMMFSIEKKQAVSLLNHIYQLHEDASLIITTNKSPDEWVNVINDEVFDTAMVDRLVSLFEVVEFSGKSLRLEFR